VHFGCVPIYFSDINNSADGSWVNSRTLWIYRVVSLCIVEQVEVSITKNTAVFNQNDVVVMTNRTLGVLQEAVS